MMKKFPILLMLILALMLPTALAENTASYVPGSATETLFAEAFERGDMVTLDMAFDLTLSENAGEIFGEETETLAALAELLDHMQLSIGAGKIDGGIRAVLAGSYTVNEQSAALDAAFDLTSEGIAVSGSFLPGERLTAKWETLLALCDLSKEDISSIMSLREADFETMLAELAEQIAPMLDMVVQIAAPYGQTVLKHIEALPIETLENVPAEGIYPAAATEISISITAKALGDLITDLADFIREVSL